MNRLARETNSDSHTTGGMSGSHTRPSTRGGSLSAGAYCAHRLSSQFSHRKQVATHGGALFVYRRCSEEDYHQEHIQPAQSFLGNPEGQVTGRQATVQSTSLFYSRPLPTDANHYPMSNLTDSAAHPLQEELLQALQHQGQASSARTSLPVAKTALLSHPHRTALPSKGKL